MIVVYCRKTIALSKHFSYCLIDKLRNKIWVIGFFLMISQINLNCFKITGIKKQNAVIPIERIERFIPPWKTVRVFISSTFKDMHGERDLITRYVFPELRSWCFNYCVNIHEVDLRWGVTQKNAESAKLVLLSREYSSGIFSC